MAAATASSPSPRRWPLVAAVLVVLVLAALLVSTALGWTGIASLRATGVVDPGWTELHAINVDFYHQEGGQVVLTSSQAGCTSCPLELRGGSHLSFVFLTLSPGNATTYRMNVTSALPFEEFSCSYSGPRPADWPAVGCPYVTSYVGVPTTIAAGTSISYPLNISVPNPAPSPFLAFSVLVTVNIQP